MKNPRQRAIRCQGYLAIKKTEQKQPYKGGIALFGFLIYSVYKLSTERYLIISKTSALPMHNISVLQPIKIRASVEKTLITKKMTFVAERLKYLIFFYVCYDFPVLYFDMNCFVTLCTNNISVLYCMSLNKDIFTVRATSIV